MISFLFVFSDLALLLIRIVLGLILVLRGWSKLKNPLESTERFSGTSLKPGFSLGTIVALFECVGGLAIVVGFFVQVIAVLVFVQFLIIVLVVKKGSLKKGRLEFLILAVAAALATSGSGIYGLDQYLGLVLY